MIFNYNKSNILNRKLIAQIRSAVSDKLSLLRLYLMNLKVVNFLSLQSHIYFFKKITMPSKPKVKSLYYVFYDMQIMAVLKTLCHQFWT